MKVGDLIQDKETKDVGLILKIDLDRTTTYLAREEPYLVLGTGGNKVWLDKDYIEEGCEIINESR